jgi:hypothetical protein
MSSRRFRLTGSVVLALGLVLGAATGRSAAVSGPRPLKHGVVNSIACPAAGNCVAGGWYHQRSHVEAFLVTETNGVWGMPFKVPGLATINTKDYAGVDTVSCSAVGDCAAGGFYYTTDRGIDIFRYFKSQAFVVSETNGVWRKAIEVPGSEKLNAYGSAGVYSISCAAAGECAAGGAYVDRGGAQQAFVASESHGRWAKAIEVPGSGKLNGLGDAAVNSVLCGAAGECAAGGYYSLLDSGSKRGFVVTETNGVWGHAVKWGPTGFSYDDVTVDSVSCPAVGACAAGGHAQSSDDPDLALVSSQTNGTWSAPTDLPGFQALSSGFRAGRVSVSCSAVGACAAGGTFGDDSGGTHVFVAGEANGSWEDAIEVPGTATLNSAHHADVNAISCAAPGECAAGGYYSDSPHTWRPFVVDETNGTWGTAIEVPGAAMLSTGNQASVKSISCGAAGNCVAGGEYLARRRSPYVKPRRAFLADETTGKWDSIHVLTFPAN